MLFMPIFYITIVLPILLATVVNVIYEMGINDISTYPSLHTHQFLKMFLDLFTYTCLGLLCTKLVLRVLSRVEGPPFPKNSKF